MSARSARTTRRIPAAPPRGRAVVVLTALVALLATPGAAVAHTSLETADPAPGATVSVLDAVRLEYAAPVDTGGVNAIGLFGPDDDELAASEDVVVDERVLELPVDAALPGPGEYTVRWRITAEDGDRQDGAYEFTYDGPATDPGRSAPTSPAPTPAPAAATTASPTDRPTGDPGAATTTPSAEPSATPVGDAGEEGGGGPSAAVVAAVLVVLLGGAGAVTARRRGAGDPGNG